MEPDCRQFIIYTIFVLSATLPCCVESSRILVSVLGVSGSQNLVMYRLAEFLGERGHDVVVLRAQVFPEAQSIPLKYSRELVYEAMPPEMIAPLREKLWSMPWEMTESSPLPLGLFRDMFFAFVYGCDTLITNDTKIMTELRREKFDVAIVHMIDFCAFGLMPSLDIKGYIWMSSAFMIEPQAWYAGVPYPSSYVPVAPHAVTPQMTFIQRGKNLLMGAAMQGALDFLMLPAFTKLFRKTYGPEYPALDEILRNTSLHFVNSDPFYDYPRPIQHNIIYMGGFTSQKPDPLEPAWQKILNESQEGVVIFSMGSVVNTEYMPNQYKSAFLNAFKRFPKYTFVCRIEGEIPGKETLKNVVISSWLPQKDLIAHQKVRALITHGGYNSMTEATYNGVPLVMMPLFGDQFANFKRIERLNIGVFLDKFDITQDTVYKALKDVLENNEIQHNSDRLSAMIHKKPVSSFDLAMNWIEFLAEFKTVENLLPESRNLSIVRYYMLDVLSITFGVVFLGFLAVIKLILVCIRYIFRRKQKTE